MHVTKNKSTKIADDICRQILTRRIAPGARLASMRKLSDFYNTSTRAVFDALALLEKNKLVERSHGNGVFACKGVAQSNLEIGIIDWNTEDIFFQEIVQKDNLRKGYSFTTRSVTPQNPENLKEFKYELNRLNQILNVDCILMHAPQLNKKQIEICLQIGTPVIFLGDFAGGTYPEFELNQLAGDNRDLGIETCRALHENLHCKQFIFYINSLDCYYRNEHYKGMLEEAKKLGMEMFLVEMPPKSDSKDKQIDHFLHALNSINVPDIKQIPAINCDVEFSFLERFINNGVCSSEIYRLERSGGKAEFYDVIYKEISRAVKNPNEFTRIKMRISKGIFEKQSKK